ncbi:MAG: Tetrahydromethanopterin:alpha-L-glutamate ligase [Methanosaeta sp. PtaU1.Bin060]|nr:MAG: Tetrahydromethanopterin:alpha-L-glutamate ligase [Methanosaeta sp. PtaU1.Bin060]
MSMRSGIVVSDPDDWTARALQASFVRRGFDTPFLDFSDLQAVIGEGGSICSRGMNLQDLDLLVIRDLGRHSAGDLAFRFETLRELERLGVLIVNPPEAIAGAANKFATSLALQRAGVPTPRTVVTGNLDEALSALRVFERAVSKPLFGYKGRDILLLQSGRKGAEGDAEELQGIIKRQGIVYLQEFIESATPRDIRAFVVGDEVSGAIYRVAPKGAWISNLARGGRAEPCPLTGEIADLAVRASHAVGAVYSGVDLLETPQGLKVIEVNGTPSGRGIFEALGADVAEKIADLVILLRESR